jgi:hypothetical protein
LRLKRGKGGPERIKYEEPYSPTIVFLGPTKPLLSYGYAIRQARTGDTAPMVLGGEKGKRRRKTKYIGPAEGHRWSKNTTLINIVQLTPLRNLS